MQIGRLNFRIKMLDITLLSSRRYILFNRILRDISILLSPYHYYFIQGHSHLTERDINEVRNTLEYGGLDVVKQYDVEMATLIGSGYGLSFAAGRMAFYSLLKSLNIGNGDEVILLGFTCSVMVNAVLRTGAKPVFTDVDLETFGSDPKAIEDKITNHTRMVVAQHTFGIPCKIEEIANIVRKYGLFLVEDCALTLDSSSSGIKVGNFGDAAIFSTDHTKPLNTLIGGFLYTRDSKLFGIIAENAASLPHIDVAHQRRLYERFLYERTHYAFGRHRSAIFRNGLASFNRRLFMTNRHPVFLEEDYGNPTKSSDKYPYPAKIPPFLAHVGLLELKRWNNEREKRINLHKSYISIMRTSGGTNWLPKAYEESSLDIVPLRFVFTHPDAVKIRLRMEKYVDTNMFWFKKPIVCCPDGIDTLGYINGTCRKSEEAGANIINWPCVIPNGGEEKILEVFQKVMCF